MYGRDDELSVGDAAAILGCSRWTVYSWAARGLLKSRRHDGHRFLLTESVLAFIKRRERIARLKADAA